MRIYLKKIKATRSQFYIAASWINSSKMIIKNNKIMILHNHNANRLNLRWQVYFDESEKNKNVIIATINFNWNKRKRLKDVDITITYHDKFEKLIIIVEELIDYCEKAINARDKIYKIYFDN